MAANRELAERVGLLAPRGARGAGALRLVTGTPAGGRARRRPASGAGATSPRGGAGGSGVTTKDRVYQFKVTLKEIEPTIWRRIAVPASYSFWDLHVAIQDAMGWSDSHLHAFRVRTPETGAEGAIGIPDDDGFEDEEVFLPGWEVPIGEYFREPGDRADYEYDFGDGWEHEVVLEEVSARAPKAKYPICVDGARACPPEDCGGVPGYEDMLQVLGDPDHEERESMLEWLGGSYDPAAFDAKKIRFDDPKKRWRVAFADEEP
jgi:Plasmid pRiA4b ORF-3-like protein